MIGPVILPLNAAVSAVAAASSHEQVVDASAQVASLNHVHVFDMARSPSGLLVASHASHASHSSHVSSSLPGGGTIDTGPTTVVVTTAPTAPSWVYATASNGNATVTWSPVYSSDGGSVTYVITAYPGGGTATVVGTTTALIQGLRNGVTYTFTVTAVNSAGTGPVSVASGGTTPTAPLLSAHRPIIRGQAAVHQKLEADTPGWLDGTTFSYQWFADGSRIRGATDRRYVPTARFHAQRITVAVVGSKPGYRSPSAITSASTHKVAVAAMPKIRGTAAVGKTLHASTGKWTTGTEFTYRWYAGDTKIAGASAPSLVVKPRYVGKAITVQVSGTKTGYGKVTLKSNSTHHIRD